MRRILRITAILVLNTMLILLLGELIVRSALWSSALTPRPQEAEFAFSAAGYGDLRPDLNNVERLYPIRPYFLQTNSVGLRNIEELNPDSAVFRVLVIGDSFVYGLYVHNQETFPARLEERLNELLATPVQALNAGVPGYTISDELDYLRDKGLALEPDLVVMGVYTNDIFDFYPKVREWFARPVVLSPPVMEYQSPVRLFLRDHVALYSVLMNLRAGMGESNIREQVNRVTPTIEGLDQLYRDLTFWNPAHYTYEWQAYESTLRETIGLLNERGIPLVIVAFPDLAQMPLEGGLPDPPQQMLARVAAETGTHFLDLLPIFRRAGDIQSLYLMYYRDDVQVDPNALDAAVARYSGDGHPSPYGHLVAARALADLLIERRIAPA